MVGRVSTAVCIVLAALVPISVQAGDERSLDPVDEVLALTEAVLAEHILPPTRQELVLAAIRAGYAHWNISPPSDLSRQVSDASSSELRRLLQGCADAIPKDRFLIDELRMAFRSGLLAVVPGDADVSPASDEQVAEQFRSNRYIGIGVAIRGNPPTFAHVIPDGPAEQAGVQANDLILQIDGEPVQDPSMTRLIERLRGEEGTDVTLVVQQPNATEARTMTVTRRVVPFKTMTYELLTVGSSKVAYVQLQRLSGSSVHELEQHRIEFEANDIAGLVLDLSSTEPGTVHQAVLLADAFLDGGSIGRVVTPEGPQDYSAEPDELFPDLRMALIVGEQTRGTVEWFAAALQDNNRATVFGQQTSGDAYVHDSVALPQSSDVLRLPTAVLQRTDGRRLLRLRADAEPPPVAFRVTPLDAQIAADAVPVPWGATPNVTVPVQEIGPRRAAQLLLGQPPDPWREFFQQLIPPTWDPATDGAAPAND